MPHPPLKARNLDRLVPPACRAQTIAAGAGFFLICLLSQMLGGAFRGEFARNADEPAHFVTGVMVRQYLAGGLSGSPLAFAEDYYVHYPKVAIGHWPPGFYALQGIWMLAFPVSRASSLGLIAVLMAVLALTLFRIVRRDQGSFTAFLAGATVQALPIVRGQIDTVMSDLPAAVLVLLATLAFARFMESQRWQHALGFGLVSSLAILTRGSGWALALLPPLAILLAREFRRVTRLAFWLPVPVVLTCCGPWYWLTRKMMSNGFDPDLTSLSWVAALGFQARAWLASVGLALFLLAAWGCWRRVLKPQDPAARSWPLTSLTALLLGELFFHSFIVPALDPRFLLPAICATVPLAFAGVTEVATTAAQRFDLSRTFLQGALSASLLALAAGSPVVPRPEAVSGFKSVAADLCARPPGTAAVVLVDSDATGEGAFIAELASREPRPRRFVVRSSKGLAESRWDGGEYRLRFESPAEVQRYLESIPIEVVVLDVSHADFSRYPHHAQLAACLDQNRGQWRLAGTYPAQRSGRMFPQGIRVYGAQGAGPVAPERFRVNMRHMLNRDLPAHP